MLVPDVLYLRPIKFFSNPLVNEIVKCFESWPIAVWCIQLVHSTSLVVWIWQLLTWFPWQWWHSLQPLHHTFSGDNPWSLGQHWGNTTGWDLIQVCDSFTIWIAYQNSILTSFLMSGVISMVNSFYDHICPFWPIPCVINPRFHSCVAEASEDNSINSFCSCNNLCVLHPPPNPPDSNLDLWPCKWGKPVVICSPPRCKANLWVPFKYCTTCTATSQWSLW